MHKNIPFQKMWCKILPVLVFALQIPQLFSVGISVNNNTTSHGVPFYHESKNINSESNTSRRIIRRFAPRFKLPKPKLPTLPKPSLPFNVFGWDPPKGEIEIEPDLGKNARRRPSKTSRPTESQEERTLLAAKKAIFLKKAILAKKAIILAKLKKKAILKNKAAAAYGLHKLSKVKGFTLKGPNVLVTLGSPPAKGKGASKEEKSEEEDEATFNSGGTAEDSDSDEDDDDDDDNLDEYDEDDKPTHQVNAAAASLYTQNSQQQTQENMVTTTSDSETDEDVDDPDEDDKPKPQVNAATASTDSQNSQQQPQQNIMMTLTMMQQLQQQLQQKQQEQQQQKPELLLAQQQQQQQQQAVVITPVPVAPTETPLAYGGGSKKGKKKGKKKKKGKATPRPVNLGVKANLYKKFDKLTKKAQNQFSSFIQIDVDFFRSDPTTGHPDLVEPARFVARTARISDNSNESVEGFDFVRGVEVPGNFMPPWIAPIWQREYPVMSKIKSDESGFLCNDAPCELKPVYIVYNI